MVKGTSGQRLAFGIIRNDGAITPHPPVTRALSMVAEALTKAGHEIIDWQPPSHAHGLEVTFRTWLYDGGKDVHESLGLSGEQIAEQVAMVYGTKAQEQKLASDIAATNVMLRQWRKEYLDYWNSTASITKSGRPVDGVICPLAPFAAARPTRYKYYGYSAFVNGLDYTSAVVPVTNANKNIDVWPTEVKPLNADDEVSFGDYDAEIYDGAHVSLQIIGRRFTEERMIAIAAYVGSLLGR